MATDVENALNLIKTLRLKRNLEDVKPNAICVRYVHKIFKYDMHFRKNMKTKSYQYKVIISSMSNSNIDDSFVLCYALKWF